MDQTEIRHLDNAAVVSHFAQTRVSGNDNEQFGQSVVRDVCAGQRSAHDQGLIPNGRVFHAGLGQQSAGKTNLVKVLLQRTTPWRCSMFSLERLIRQR